jgi:hypothetical protein
MHIHGNMNSQAAAFLPTQSAQQAMAASKASAAVRSKLAGFAAKSDAENDAVSHVNPYAESGQGRRQDQQQQEDAPFRSVYVSVSA